MTCQHRFSRPHCSVPQPGIRMRYHSAQMRRDEDRPRSLQRSSPLTTAASHRPQRSSMAGLLSHRRSWARRAEGCLPFGGTGRSRRCRMIRLKRDVAPTALLTYNKQEQVTQLPGHETDSGIDDHTRRHSDQRTGHRSRAKGLPHRHTQRHLLNAAAGYLIAEADGQVSPSTPEPHTTEPARRSHTIISGIMVLNLTPDCDTLESFDATGRPDLAFPSEALDAQRSCQEFCVSSVI